MLFRCLLLLVCLTAICAQKGGERRPSASSPSRILAGRKIPQLSEPIQQVKEPEDPDERKPEEDTREVVAVVPRRPTPPRFQPQPVPVPQPLDDPSGHPAPEPYSFSYAVDDPESGANTARQETQDINGEIVGFYYIKDAEGRSRRVDYTAGKEGFKATIKSNEEGVAAKDPADVNIELSASPSENRYVYSPNQRPVARQPVAVRPIPVQPIARDPIVREPEPSESNLKSYGRPPQQKFFQRLISSPVPQPIEQKPEESQIEQKAEEQISQSYETSDPSESEIVQQRNVDEEEVPFESAPVKGGPSPSVSTYRPTERPIGQFTPQRIQTFRENGLVNFQPVLNRISQVREEIPNSIQDTQTPAETSAPLPSPPTKSVAPPQPSYQALRPLVTPTLYQWPQPLATVPNLAPIQPVSNNIVFQHKEHRQPISQDRLLNYFQPLAYTVPSPQIVYSPPVPQPVQLTYPRYQTPLNSGYQVSIQHRETQPISQVRTDTQRVQSEIRSETRVPEVRPLPSPPVIEQKAEESFEPQVYEPIQQTYEPLQQTYEPLQQFAEDPAEESRSAPPKPPCKCDQPQEESVPQPVKGNNIQPSEPAPIKSGRLSPARAFIPQAFRTQ